MSTSDKSIVAVGAHSADFVWRAGGAIALYHDLGYQVHVICLSYGERLGATIEFLDAGDYPLEVTPELRDSLVQSLRAYRPEFILTHSLEDPYNADHPRTTALVLESRILAQAHGYPSYKAVIGAPPVFLYEPHQPEQCNFQVDMLLDITSVFERNDAVSRPGETQADRSCMRRHTTESTHMLGGC
ncbi:PIG-L deacetylase family protein [Alicyclobacillus dauci]|uniref:PIG-L family deacetylase n=1 Tax=Alicyclobacillus dauci TaxID=1475485 RepID=A0ABY6YZE8_9BACL|nr:PIG-L deacetylase family protein [Alicyclobacillus dauci]WAH35683.1 PIG-L family deacetylase [Alicyclobacillus dauci]